MKLDGLKARIDADVAQLKELLGRYSAAGDELGKIRVKLDAHQAERTRLEQERTTLEGASAVSLHRMKLDPEQAAVKSDLLLKEVASVTERESAATARSGELQSAMEADLQEITSLLYPLNTATLIFSQGELLALLCSFLDSSQGIDLADQIEANWNLFRFTFVAPVYHERTRRIKRGNETLAVAREIAAEPVVPLEQRRREIPDAIMRNSRLVTTILSLSSQ
jgi:hypothetical protein